MRAQRTRRDKIDFLTLPVAAAILAVWAVLGEAWLEPLKAYNLDVFWVIGGTLAFGVIVLGARFGNPGSE